MDITAAFGTAQQGYAAFNLTKVAGDFNTNRSVLSGLRLIDTVSDVVGIERITGQLVKYAVKLALKADTASEDAARDMVELMRSRAPVDTGLLLNGITFSREGGVWQVEASASYGGYDYALAVETGHRAGGDVADAGMFEDTSGRGGRRVRSGPTEVEGQPFFYDSAREVLSDWARNLSVTASVSASEEGL